MSDSEGRRPQFQIQRLDDGDEPRRRRRQRPKAPPPVAEPEPAPASEPVPEAVETAPSEEAKQAAETETWTATAGRFADVGAMLGFLGAVSTSGLADTAVCRRRPEKDGWWAEVEVPWDRAAELVWTAGGLPFAGSGDDWVVVPASGRRPDRDAPRSSVPHLASWRQVELAEVLGELTLSVTRPTPQRVVEVLLPGSLARWVLRRASALGVHVRLTPVRVTELAKPKSAEKSAVLVELRAPRGDLPAALVRTIVELPYTFVARSADAGEGRLLVDVRCRVPLSETLIAALLPDGERWFLGTPALGHRRVIADGKAFDAGDLVAPQVVPAPAGSMPSTPLPSALPIRLEPSHRALARVDAVLLDERERGWMATFLRTRPLGERSFLLPGADRYLLLAPGGLSSAVPFGIPLVLVGPRALFVERGFALYPSLPASAREAVFELDEEQAVVLTEGGAWRFDLENLVPSWHLWTGEAPAVRGGLSPEGRIMVEGLTARYRRRELRQLRELPEDEAPRLASEKERPEPLKRAMAAKIRGDFAEAARLMEQAGEIADAAQLYEHAARQLEL